MKILFIALVAVCLIAPAWSQRAPDLAHAIAYAEGFYVKGSKSWRNHNPGNIRRGRAYVHYRSDREGWGALYELLQRVRDGGSRFYSVNMSLKEFGRTYADGHGIWAKNVAKALSVSVTARLWELLGTHPEFRAKDIDIRNAIS